MLREIGLCLSYLSLAVSLCGIGCLVYRVIKILIEEHREKKMAAKLVKKPPKNPRDLLVEVSKTGLRRVVTGIIDELEDIKNIRNSLAEYAEILEEVEKNINNRAKELEAALYGYNLAKVPATPEQEEDYDGEEESIEAPAAGSGGVGAWYTHNILPLTQQQAPPVAQTLTAAQVNEAYGQLVGGPIPIPFT